MSLVSVIIPTYKRSSRLIRAIDSVLNQTVSNIEIIVVDDNGDNQYRLATKNILQPYLKSNQIKYICHDTNQGGCAARNTGAFAAKGNYVSFLDDDDFYEPTKIEEQVEFIKNNQELDACICSMYRVDENNQNIESRENIARGETLKEAILDGNLFTSMLFIKKEVFITLGGFSEIPRFQDKYFHYKFLENEFKLGVLNNPLLTLVDHQDIRVSLTATNKIISSLNLLATIENKHKQLFTNKENRFIKYRYNIKIAEVLCIGVFNEKLKSISYCFKAFKYASTNNYHYIFKLLLKSIIPNFILN